MQAPRDPVIPNTEAIRSALGRVLGSTTFVSAARASRFLRFVVEAQIAGRQPLKEYVLGVEVFDRGCAFDPSTDTIVRVEAVKLRKRLSSYYRGPGRHDAVVIELPKGTYAPRFRQRADRTAARGQRRRGPLSVAVLPFANLSPGEGNEFWSDGLTEELTSVLSCSTRLRVVSRTSAFAFKGRSMDVREIGRMLGARMVIEGSVRRDPSRVRVGVRLTDVATGVHVWSGTIEREIEDAWTVQQDVAKAIVEAVDVELTAGEKKRMGKRHSDNPEAFELYLKGRHISTKIETSSQREALRLFQSACAADPKYTLPLLGIARCHVNLAFMGVSPPRDTVPAVKAALGQALALDPESAEAHSLMASVICRHEWNWTEAEKHYRAALRLAPNAAEVHDAYATDYLTPMGRIEEALSENRRARELDPFAPQLRRSHALILMLGRRLADAERECRRILQEQADDTYVRIVLAISLHGQRGRTPEAVAEYERAYLDDPRLQTETYFASIRALLGDRTPAEKLLKRLRLRAQREFVPAMMFAWLHLHLGQIDEAVTAIEQAYHNGEYELLVAEVGYGFDSFRGHPRFCAIIEKLGLRRAGFTVNSP